MTKPLSELPAHDAHAVLPEEPSATSLLTGVLLILLVMGMLVFTFVRDALDASAGPLFPTL